MNKTFKQKSKTFVLRCYWDLWNSEKSANAYKSLFEMGFTDQTMQDFAIGWNSKNVRKPYSSFGLSGGKFEIPKGIVFPYLIDKEVHGFKIFSLSFDEIFKMLHGSYLPIIFDTGKSITVIVQNEITGILISQVFKNKVNVIITGLEINDKIEGLIKRSDSIIVENIHTDLIPRDKTNFYIYNSFESLVELLKSF
ncbi:MAG: hypothetical protein GY714_30540 [Desulfobacterales bacterium]|nr:hypothetical protein [Desulfobacterales bacterium]